MKIKEWEDGTERSGRNYVIDNLAGLTACFFKENGHGI